MSVCLVLDSRLWKKGLHVWALERSVEYAKFGLNGKRRCVEYEQ